MIIINTNINKHYTNKHGMELKDFMKTFMPELWEFACYWSALKYNVRAGKKDGEALEKDTGKRDDYINELIENDGLEDYSLILADLDGIKERFENWKGEKMIDKMENFERLYCKVCGEVFFISPEAYKQRAWSYCPDCGNEVNKNN